MNERISRLIGFGRLAIEEPDPDTQALHYRHMQDWDEHDHYGDCLVTALGDALSEAFRLSEELIRHQAIHGSLTRDEHPVAEWKRLVILLEQRTADTFPEQLAFDLNRLLEQGDEAA